MDGKVMNTLSTKLFISVAFLALLLGAQGAFACDRPLPFESSKKAQEIKSWAVQDRKMTKEQVALQRELGQDERRYWELDKQVMPVCMEGDGNTCVPGCKIVDASRFSEATVIEGGYHYTLPKAKREELKKQQGKLEEKWMKMQ